MKRYKKLYESNMAQEFVEFVTWLFDEKGITNVSEVDLRYEFSEKQMVKVKIKLFKFEQAKFVMEKSGRVNVKSGSKWDSKSDSWWKLTPKGQSVLSDNGLDFTAKRTYRPPQRRFSVDPHS